MGIPDPYAKDCRHRWIDRSCERCGVEASDGADDDCPVGLRQEIERLRALIAKPSAISELVDALTDARERMMGSSPAIRALIAKTDAALAKAKGAA